MTTSTPTFTHTDAEFTVYTNGDIEQTGGRTLTESQSYRYNLWMNKAAAAFDFSDCINPDDDCLIVSVTEDGEVDAAVVFYGDPEKDSINVSVLDFA
jgi:hypothetical protein